MIKYCLLYYFIVAYSVQLPDGESSLESLETSEMQYESSGTNLP